LAVLLFELRASCLLGRHSTTWSCLQPGRFDLEGQIQNVVIRTKMFYFNIHLSFVWLWKMQFHMDILRRNSPNLFLVLKGLKGL
jgi:hypothetical protein